MLPQFLIPEETLRANGAGAAIRLDSASGKVLQITMSIRRVIEQESFDLWLEGSEDGSTWLEKPLAYFPQKFYCGDYSIICDLSSHPEVRFLRAVWKMHRWGRGEATPLFEVFVVAEEARSMSASNAG